MKLKARLTSQSIKRMSEDLLSFEQGFINNLRDFRDTLANKGIQVAMSSAQEGHMGQYIVFTKQETDNSTYIIAKETSQILSEWLWHGEVVQAWVSPLLMAEFGSGPHAVVWVDSQGNESGVLSDGTKVGRGTFPDQVNAFKDSWHYMDLNYNWHTVNGEKPTRPMHNTVLEIILQIERTAKEVFGYGR